MKGIDGTRNGWITAEYAGDAWKIEFFEEISGIDFDESLIDIPIGLPENPGEGLEMISLNPAA